MKKWLQILVCAIFGIVFILQDRTLSITWCNNKQINNQRGGRQSNRTVLMSESEEDQLMIDQSLLEGEEDVSDVFL